MYCVVFALCIASVACNDIRLGFASAQSRKIFSEIKEANAALWQRTDDVIINAPSNELISAIYVTDLREVKDGEAFIESGGIGTKSVTIGLKSPSILRGYKFEIEVFGSDPNARYLTKGVYNEPIYDTQYASRKF